MKAFQHQCYFLFWWITKLNTQKAIYSWRLSTGRGLVRRLKFLCSEISRAELSFWLWAVFSSSFPSTIKFILFTLTLDEKAQFCQRNMLLNNDLDFYPSLKAFWSESFAFRVLQEYFPRFALPRNIFFFLVFQMNRESSVCSCLNEFLLLSRSCRSTLSFRRKNSLSFIPLLRTSGRL